MQNQSSPSNPLAEFYRFAVLLTGNIAKAEQVMGEVLARAERECAQIRNENSRRAWFVTRIRERCLSLVPAEGASPRLIRENEREEGLEVLEIEAYLIAQRFQRLAEPGRTALALFYLDSFTNEDIAKLLKLQEHELAEALGSARAQLETLLRGTSSHS